MRYRYLYAHDKHFYAHVFILELLQHIASAYHDDLEVFLYHFVLVKDDIAAHVFYLETQQDRLTVLHGDLFIRQKDEVVQRVCHDAPQHEVEVPQRCDDALQIGKELLQTKYVRVQRGKYVCRMVDVAPRHSAEVPQNANNIAKSVCI